MSPRISRRQFVKTQLATATGLLAGASMARGSVARSSARRPNLLFVMADQWRRQAMGYAGEDPVLTPNFDRFANDALVFDQACTTRPLCAPNRCSLLTGLHPQRHGHYTNGLARPLNPSLPTLGGFLKQAGYRTSYVGKLHTGGAAEHHHGEVPEAFRRTWDDWALAVGHQVFEQPYYLGQDTKPTTYDGWAPDFETNRTLSFIRENRDRPFAAVLSWGPPHTSGGKGFEKRWQPGKMKDGVPEWGHGYAAPAEYEAPYMPFDKVPRRPNVQPLKVPGGTDDSDRALPGYFGACTALDASFGRLIETLQELDLHDDTLIVFTSDHGEMLGSHGHMQKGRYQEESVGVPLLMRLGHRLPARRVDQVISTIDLLPTMLDLLGIEHQAQFDGISCADFALGRKHETMDAVFLSFDAGGGSEAKNLAEIAPNPIPRGWRTIRTRRYSYTLTQSAGSAVRSDAVPYLFYDIKLDPCQLRPITGGRHQPIIDDLHARLVAHLDQIGDKFFRGA